MLPAGLVLAAILGGASGVADGEGAILDQIQGLNERQSLGYRLRARLAPLLEGKR